MSFVRNSLKVPAEETCDTVSRRAGLGEEGFSSLPECKVEDDAAHEGQRQGEV